MSIATLSIQLYSLRRETANDAPGTLLSVPGLGYDGVETAGDYGWTLDEWKSILNETGLKVVGAHVGLDLLEKDFAATVEFQRQLGNMRIIVPYVQHELKRAVFENYASRFNTMARLLANEGMTFLYHNHAFEFSALLDDGRGIDVLLENTDPSLVKFEFDTYWLERGGEDAVAFLQKHESRVGMIHAKELKKSDQSDVAAGLGDVDFQTIIPMARANDWEVVVEFEGEDAPRVMKESAAYLRKI